MLKKKKLFTKSSSRKMYSKGESICWWS